MQTTFVFRFVQPTVCELGIQSGHPQSNNVLPETSKTLSGFAGDLRLNNGTHLYSFPPQSLTRFPNVIIRPANSPRCARLNKCAACLESPPIVHNFGFLRGGRLRTLGKQKGSVDQGWKVSTRGTDTIGELSRGGWMPSLCLN
eukprot:1182425-Pyramimonas_sp.AAC.1